MTALPEIADRVGGLRVLVIGEAMLDSYLIGRAERLCREGPVPIVALEDREDAPGGAANAAANVQGLGGEVRFVSVIGDDPEGERLRRSLRAHGVSDELLVVEPGRHTLAKHRVLAGDQLLVRYDSGGTGELGDETLRRLVSVLEREWPEADAVLVSDYGYGVLSAAVIDALRRLRGDGPLVVDAKDASRHRRLAPTAVKPNYAEAAQLLAERELPGGEGRLHQVAAGASRILERTGAGFAAVTLDREGALVLERDQPPHRTYARPERQGRSCGAGDTFAAALTLALGSGATPISATELAAAAAAVVVGKDGTATCSAGELSAYLGREPGRILDPAALAERAELYHRQGRRIVFTNGCFDILHRGHVAYLNRAKAQGDVLVVAVNGDDSVRRLKGSDRPVNSLEDRLQVLAALSCIDHLVPFDADTPVDLLERVRPDLYVKGGDYAPDQLPEAPVVERLGGAVRILPYVEDRSTSAIIGRIRTNGGDGQRVVGAGLEADR